MRFREHPDQILQNQRCTFLQNKLWSGEQTVRSFSGVARPAGVRAARV